MMAETLDRAIARRGKHRELKVDLARMRYLNSLLFDVGVKTKATKTLYVGVGHGHDALLSIIDNQTERVIGVDPFIGGHGNNDEDFRLLIEIIDELGLAERFTLKRMYVQEYLDEATDKVDRIVCNDVLHHIFVTSERLTKSELYPGAVELFAKFRDAITDDGVLVVADVGRHGLRQYLHGVARPLGFARFQGNYVRKQQWTEWDAALQEAGWRREAVRNYVPFSLREHKSLQNGWLGRATLCDKYVLTYRNR